MLPALERQQRADAALRELFEAVIGLAATRGRVAPMAAVVGRPRPAAVGQWLGSGLAARSRRGSARDHDHAADNGLSEGDQFAGEARPPMNESAILSRFAPEGRRSTRQGSVGVGLGLLPPRVLAFARVEPVLKPVCGGDDPPILTWIKGCAGH